MTPLVWKYLYICSNNHIEGFHNRLQAAFNCSHPNVWTLLAVLKKEHNLSVFKRNQILGGRDDKRKSKYVKYNARLAHMMGKYTTLRIIPYLELMASNLML